MVNKPAGLYLEDALLSANNPAHLPNSATANHHNTRNYSASPRHAALRPVTLIRAGNQGQWRDESPFTSSIPIGTHPRSLVQARQIRSPQAPRSGPHQVTSIAPIDVTSHSFTSHRWTSDMPEVLYAQLDTGFFFECFVSRTEQNSYISEELFNHIHPRPILLPARPQHRLRFNGETYTTLGLVSFSLHMASPDDASKEIELCVTASVVAGIYPDLFLGRD